MQSTDITAKIKNYIRFGLVTIILLAALIGYAEFQYWHRSETIELTDAKVAGTMVSVRVLANGKVKELLFEDGAEIKAGDVIARLEVAITEEEIQQLEDTVQLARDNYAELQAGQTVTVPVQRERVVYPPAPPPTVTYSGTSPSSLARLEERANRMAELFDMGAVSAVERDKARAAYESALAESQTVVYEYAAAPQPIIEYYTEYVEEFRPTPPEVLAGAEQAIRQAELSLNVALQEARETDVIAPVSGTIYYGIEVEQDLSAGESIARVGDSRELWIEAEVTEDIFNKIPLGKLVSCSIDGRELFGTVIEKIKPNVPETAEETPESIELPEIPTTENQPGALISDNPDAENSPAENSPVENSLDDNSSADNLPAENSPAENSPVENSPAENSPAENPPADNLPAENPPAENSPAENLPAENSPADNLPAENSPAENSLAEKIREVLDWFRDTPQIVEAETEVVETPAENSSAEKIREVLDSFRDIPAENIAGDDSDTPAPAENIAGDDSDTPAENSAGETPADENPAPNVSKFLDGTENRPKPNDKFIIKISLPAERDFECRPNTKVIVKIKI